jgi:NagD protein
LAFLTNNPLERAATYAAKLDGLGLGVEPAEIVTSIDALLSYLGHRGGAHMILPVTEPLLEDILVDAGFAMAREPEEADVVVVAFDRTFDYAKLHRAYRAVRAGARIVATNPDPFCPTPDGGLPDCAAMLAAIEACTGERAEAVVGKPSAHMAATVLDRLGLPAERVLMVGDRLATDVALARRAGMRSALVLTGATSAGDLRAEGYQPDYVIETLLDLGPGVGIKESHA